MSSSSLLAIVSPMSRAQQLWNQWEIQCLVVVSLSLQAFLLLFSGLRKRHASRVLSVLLWLAYLLADYVAAFALGRLTLHLNDPRHQLVLFWTPFLLLHLGGQETIAAFSTEDSLLWKRHLLSLVSQVSLAVYIVAKSWHIGSGSSSKRLVAPTALMFIAATIKYVERTWALMTAGRTMTPGSGSMTDHVLHAEGSVIDDAKSYFQRLNEVVSSAHRDGKVDYEGLVGVAGKGIRMCVEFVTDMTPFLMWHNGDIIDRTIKNLQDLRNRQLQLLVAYNLADIHLSLIYDFFYTKYGVLQFHLNQLNSGIQRLITCGATWAALALFLLAHLSGFFFDLSRADVMVSYLLLIGAVALDLSSILMVFSSYWPYLSGRGPFGGDGFMGKSELFNVMKLANPLGKGQWSGKMAQYNLITDCIQERQANLFMKALRKIGLTSDITSMPISPQLKEFVFIKLLGIASTRHVNEYWRWDFGTFRGQWLRWELEASEEGKSIDTAVLNIEGGHFAGIVLMWHITTNMCFYTDSELLDDPPHSYKAMSMELSNYVLYLVAKCGVKSGSNGYFELGKLRRDLRKTLSHERFSQGRLDQSKVALYGCEGHGYFSARAVAVIKELRKITCPNHRWELIATVWTEMLCYLAPNCEAGFHIKNLSSGGEFVTHIRILQIILGIPFLREPTEAKTDDEYSDFVMF